MPTTKLLLTEALGDLAAGIARSRRLIAATYGTDEANDPTRRGLLAEADEWDAQAAAFRAGRVK